jgi:hypothetical protein
MASLKRTPAPLLSHSQVRVEKTVKAKNAVLIVGLPGIGLVSKLATDSVAAQAKSARVASLFSPHFPNQVLALNTGQLKPFKISLTHAKIKGRDAFFVQGDLQPLTVEGQYEVTSKILSFFARRCGGVDVLAMAGYAVPGKKDKPALYAATTNAKMLAELKTKGVKTLPHPVPIVGLGGMLPALAPLYGLRGACLLVETTGSPIDSNGGVALLDFLNKYFGSSFESKTLVKHAKNAEALAARMQQQAQAAQGQVPAGEPHLSGAVDELAKKDATRYIR